MGQTNTDPENQQALVKENIRFRKLLEIQRKIGTERDLNKLLPLIIQEISSVIEADRTTIFLIDWETLELQARFAEGLVDKEFSIKLRMGIVGWAVLTKQVIGVANAYEHPYFNPDIDQIHGFRTESILVAPIIDQTNQALGAIELLNKKTGCFNQADHTVIQNQAAELSSRLQECEITADEAQTMVNRLCRETNCERGSLFVINEETSQLSSLYAANLKPTDITLNLKLGVAGLVAVTGKILNITEAQTDPRFNKSIDLKTQYITKTIIGLPITNPSGEIIGVLEVINKQHGSFDENDIQLLEGLTSIVAIAIANAIMLSEQERQFRSILEVMAASIDAKDSLTAGHSARVTEYATGIARQLGFSTSDLDVISTASLLHDYGKLGIDDNVLKKPGKLNEEEYDHIKEHVAITRHILEKMRFARKYRNVPNIAAAHHECLDGTGYNSGLHETEIPFMARIITVADVFEALTAQRHYRAAMPVKTAFAILHEGIGTKFDANVVDALEKYWQTKGRED